MARKKTRPRKRKGVRQKLPGFSRLPTAAELKPDKAMRKHLERLARWEAGGSADDIMCD